MKRILHITSVFISGAVAGALGMPALNAQTRPTVITEIVRTDLGAWCPGKEATIVVQESGPGTSSRHYHPGHSYSYVLEGSETRNVEGKPAQSARVGQLIHEEPMEVGQTRNVVPVRLLVFSIFEKGQPVTTRVP